MLKESRAKKPKDTVGHGLNPYFNGTCSKSQQYCGYVVTSCSLNPYFNGTCSKSMSVSIWEVKAK